uniref:amidase n=1 Tax=Epichloe coenophiala TaxID=5047 RepID=R9W1R1_EPICN|nr:LolN [Epichloe coenophiala]
MSNMRATIAGGARWQEVAADCQQHRDATIAKIHPPIPDTQALESLFAGRDPRDVSSIPTLVLSEEELAITSANVEDLVSRLASGDWSASTVLKAFLRRAALAQRLVNCVTEMLSETALKRAAELDEHLAVHGKPIGPLHGVPISVKEHIAMKGLDVNGGYVSEVGRVAEEDALILSILRDAGAIFYVRTTEPQSSMHLETSSSLYGETVNPFNTTLTSGGSSGGEGAIIAMRGSVLGVGSDIGGSIRSPAHCNGIFGFKPTAGRLPTLGWFALMVGSEAIHATTGPLSTSIEGLRLFTKTLLDAKPWLQDPSLTPMEWRDMSTAFAGRRLKVAVMWDDGVVKPHPPVTRALKSVVKALKKSEKIEVVDWKPWKHNLAWSIIAGLYFCDGGAQLNAAFEAAKEPLRPLSHWILKENPHVKHHSIASLWSACAERDAYRLKYAELWNDTAKGGSGQVDVILCPAGPGAAPKLNTSRYWGYTAQWNLLDYPAVVFPTGDIVSVEKDGAAGEQGGGDPASGADLDNWSLWTEHGAEGYSNAPLALQLVARRYDDEKLLHALEMVMKEGGTTHGDRRRSQGPP